MFLRALYWKKLLIASFMEHRAHRPVKLMEVYNTFFDQI